MLLYSFYGLILLIIIFFSPASSTSFVIITIMHPTQALLSCQLETPSYIGSGLFCHMRGIDMYSVPHFADLGLISFSYNRSCNNAFVLLGTRY
jgi:hypothetical protein